MPHDGEDSNHHCNDESRNKFPRQFSLIPILSFISLFYRKSLRGVVWCFLVSVELGSREPCAPSFQSSTSCQLDLHLPQVPQVKLNPVSPRFLLFLSSCSSSSSIHHSLHQMHQHFISIVQSLSTQSPQPLITHPSVRRSNSLELTHSIS